MADFNPLDLLNPLVGVGNSIVNYKLGREQQLYDRQVDAQNQANIDRQFEWQTNFDTHKNQIQAADMMAAGINPISGASGASGSSASTGTIASPSQAPIMGNSGLEALYQIQQIQSTENMNDKNLAQQKDLEDKARSLAMYEINLNMANKRAEMHQAMLMHNDQMKLQRDQLKFQQDKAQNDNIISALGTVYSLVQAGATPDAIKEFTGVEIPREMYDSILKQVKSSGNRAERVDSYEDSLGAPLDALGSTTKEITGGAAVAAHQAEKLLDMVPTSKEKGQHHFSLKTDPEAHSNAVNAVNERISKLPKWLQFLYYGSTNANGY